MVGLVLVVLGLVLVATGHVAAGCILIAIPLAITVLSGLFD